MSDDFLKGIGRFIPPELRRFAPTFKAAAELLKPNPIVNNPSTANLLRSPSLANLGKVLSDVAITSTEVLPGGKLITTPVKKTSKLTSDIIKKQLDKGKKLTEAIQDIDSDLIKTFSMKDLQKHLKDNYDLDVGDRVLLKKIQKLNVPTKKLRDPNISKKLKKAFEEIGDTSKFTEDELFNTPQIQKIVDEGFLTKTRLKELRNKLGFGITRRVTPYFERFGLDHDNVIEYITKNNPTNTELIKKFPKLEEAIKAGDVQQYNIATYRMRNNLSHIPDLDKKKIANYQILQATNPELSKFLEFIPQSGDKALPSNIPIKHKDGFTDIATINTKSGPIDRTRTNIIQAHAMGEGSINNASKAVVESKVRMIPDKFLNEVLQPKFFLTRSENMAHRSIENNLVSALVERYKILGYEFVDDGWKQVKKVNLKSVNPKIKSLDKDIEKYQDKLKDINAYSQFYNPIKDKLVTYGTPESDVLPLSQLMSKVISGEKKLNKGGIVSMEEMIKRPIYERY
jgi:hypothetical protein